MAKKGKEAIDKHPSAEIESEGSILISLLTILLILVGIADIGLMGYCGIAVYQNKKNQELYEIQRKVAEQNQRTQAPAQATANISNAPSRGKTDTNQNYSPTSGEAESDKDLTGVEGPTAPIQNETQAMNSDQNRDGEKASGGSKKEDAPQPPRASAGSQASGNVSISSVQPQATTSAKNIGPNDGTKSSGNGTETYTHDFSGGKVLITKASDNNNDPVYHTRDCMAAKKISPSDEYWYDSAKDAEADGRRLCGNCKR